MTETVGQFRLIQKIEDDVLGELYCAAWPLGAGAAEEQTVLLRLYDREGIRPERFLQRVAGRRPLVGTRISDHLATSSHLGVADGRAFDAAPFVSGQSLAAVIRLATKHRQPVPVEVALFIVGRAAAGLGSASRRELDGESVLHGFLTPDLMMVSEEGRVRVCGLEAAPALRGFRGTATAFARILPYLSPESSAGEDLHPSDDVYSLGAVLFELLTLKPPASSTDLRVESARIPGALRYFLDRSLAPRFRRIQTVVEWLRELKTVVIEEEWAASTRDLSAFLAELDERVNPLEPDTSEITGRDREALAEAIEEAHSLLAAEEEAYAAGLAARETAIADEATAEPDPAQDEPALTTELPAPSKNATAYDTSVISRKVLDPPEVGRRARR